MAEYTYTEPDAQGFPDTDDGRVSWVRLLLRDTSPAAGRSWSDAEILMLITDVQLSLPATAPTRWVVYETAAQLCEQNADSSTISGGAVTSKSVGQLSISRSAPNSTESASSGWLRRAAWLRARISGAQPAHAASPLHTGHGRHVFERHQFDNREA